MKLVLLHYSAPPVVGGVESVMGEHARLMAAHGHEVCILAGRGSAFHEDIRFQQISLLDSRHPDIQSVKAELDRGMVSEKFHALVELLENELRNELAGTDILIAHNVCSLHKNLALTAALHHLSKQPWTPALILWHHDLAWTTPRYQAELHSGYPWDILRQDWPWAKQVVVSEMRQRELSRLIGVPTTRIQVIPNGIDPVRFFKLGTQAVEFVQRLHLLDSSPLLLLPVRITPRKNIELALRTLSELKKNYPQAALVVTGPLGPHNPANVQYFSQLINLRKKLRLGKSAHFLAELNEGYLPDEVITDLYRLVDALFLPSREEGFGIPMLEAGLQGIPIFCTDIDPLQKLGGGYVTYFSPDSAPGKVADLISEYLAGSSIFHMREEVRIQYTWEQIYRTRIEPLIEKFSSRCKDQILRRKGRSSG